MIPASAQEYSYKHYEVKDGLVGNNVYQVLEDKEGFIWFATETGVSRFDGTTFRNFTVADGLPDDEILKLFADSRGRVWMLPFKNAVCYYYQGKIFNAGNDSLLRKVAIKDCVNLMFESGEGDLFFLMQEELMVITKNGAVLKHANGSKDMIAYGGGVNEKGFPLLFMGEDTRLYRAEINSGKIAFHKLTDSIRFYGKNIQYSYISPRMLVYANNYNSKAGAVNSLLFKRPGAATDTIPLPPQCYSISFESDSLLYFHTSHGALKYNYNRKSRSRQFLPFEKVSGSLTDSEGNVWFTTLGRGVFRLYSEETKNIFFPGDHSNASIESVYANSKSIFAGSSDSKIYHFSKTGEPLRWASLWSAGVATKLLRILPHNKELYILGENAVYTADTALKQLKPFVPARQSLHWTFKDMNMGLNDTLYFSTHSAALYATRKAPEELLPFFMGRSTAICRVDSGIYLGTLQGLLFIDNNKNTRALGQSVPLLRNRVTKLLAARDKLWIGTVDQGVLCFDGRSVVKSISASNGLTGNLIRSMFASGQFLWVGTNHGLNKIDISSDDYPVMQQYNTTDGINSEVINAIYVKDDTVYVATPNGLSYFNEKKLHQHSNCRLAILGITVSGKNLPIAAGPVFLQKNDNNIRFDFVALSIKSEGDIRYYYKLSGIDPEWKVTRENFLQYPRIPSGNYELQLYAVNKFGVKSNMVNIHFEVEKKFTETAWFYGLASAGLLAIAVMLVNWRIRRLKRIQQERMASAERITLLEQQALKSQMNPHFIFNCLNSIQQYVIDKDVQGANKFISGFSKLIRQTLDNSGKKAITVAEEESFLRSYLELEKSRFEDKFDYAISISKAIRKDEDSLPPMLLQPYIENCIRHGIMHKSNGKGYVEILFNVEDKNLVCSVTDNGIGRVAADEIRAMQHNNHQSKGTDITRQRIVMINKSNPADIILNTEDLVDFNNQPCGTRVTIVIPMQNAG